MGKIKKILENELVGGTQGTDVYPVTSTKAVYNEDNERLDDVLRRNQEKFTELESKLSGLDAQINGGSSKEEITIDTSVHEFVNSSGVKSATSSQEVSYFEQELEKGDIVTINGSAEANWAILSVKNPNNTYTPIELGIRRGQVQEVEYTATNNCIVAFTFWSDATDTYSMVVTHALGGMTEDVETLKEETYSISNRVQVLENIVNNVVPISVEVITSNHAFVNSAGVKSTTSSQEVSFFEYNLKSGDSVKINGNANDNWAILSIKNSDTSYTPIELGVNKDITQEVEYTASEDCVVGFTFWNTRPYSMVVTSENALTELSKELSQIDERVVKIENSKRVRIEVKKSGGDFNSVTSAINYANTLNGGADIYIYDGVYDVYQEQGGDEWLAKISHSAGERQGLHLEDNVNLYGVGYVELRFELPNSVTYDQSRSVSCLNLWNSNIIENINFYAKNCRYAIHDETNGGNYNIKRYVKNCRLEHLGNYNSEPWPSMTAMGGGASGGSQYDWINCQFITHNFFQAFSYHTHNNENPSHFNIDGCVGLCLEYSGHEQIRSFCAQYYGTGHIGRSVFNFKNCTGNGDVVKRAQTPTSEDHIDVYINAYNKITL